MKHKTEIKLYNDPIVDLLYRGFIKYPLHYVFVITGIILSSLIMVFADTSVLSSGEFAGVIFLVVVLSGGATLGAYVIAENVHGDSIWDHYFHNAESKTDMQKALEIYDNEQEQKQTKTSRKII